ncbi:MAG: response regulator [Limisphaerales bacterium]
MNTAIKSKPRLLIVDVEKSSRDGLRSALDSRFEAWVAEDATVALTLWERMDFQVLLTDSRVPPEQAMKLIRRAKSLSRPPVCILMAAQGSEELAVEAMKQGADDYIAVGRMQIEELEMRITRVLRRQDLEMENLSLKQQLDGKVGLAGVTARSPGMRAALDTARQVAPAAVEHPAALSEGDRIGLQHLPANLRATADTLSPPTSPPLPEPAEDQEIVRTLTLRTIHDRIHGLFQALEGGFGRVLKPASALIGFVLLALWFDLHPGHGFSNRETMESAHLGRHLAAWKGYTTYSIRPSALGLLQRANPNHAAEVLQHPVPDLSIAPGYPFVLACLMKVLPFNFAVDRSHRWSYQPDLMITLFNELLFLASSLLLFYLARRLFDSGVAWVSAIIFAGSKVYWKFTLSGLSTMWLLLIFLLLAWCLVAMEERQQHEAPPPLGSSMALAGAAGALVGIGGLSRYSFGWMIAPVLLFMYVFFKHHRVRMCLLAAVGFLLVMTPWITRNVVLSHTPFGTAGYALTENTRPFEEDRLERSFDPAAGGLNLLGPRDLANKFLANEGRILRNDLPRLGGNWAWSFFLCGLLLPFRKPGLRHLRYFLVWSLALMAVVQPLGQTYLSAESPEINSENLLALLAPLVLMFGTGFFFVLLDQMELPDLRFRHGGAGLFALVMCAPLLLGLASPAAEPALFQYFPPRIQKTALMMSPDELMMSDIPWAVAWYGDRECAWLTLDDADTFAEMNKLKPIQAIYLTESTTDRPFLSQILGNKHSWGRFLLDSLPPSELARGTVPPNFPLTAEPSAYLPGQLFITDKVRWRAVSKK